MPSVWWQPRLPLWACVSLLPLSHVWRWGSWLWRRIPAPNRLPPGVVVVGNAVLGGAGKTPVTIWIARELRRRSIPVAAVSAGYAGRWAGGGLRDLLGTAPPVRVDRNRHDADQVGDEALLLSRVVPTWVGSRLRCVAIARKQASVVLIDDGLQHPALRGAPGLLVVDERRLFGNGRVFPAGPNREPPCEILKRVEAVVVLSSGASDPNPGPAVSFPGLPIYRGQWQTLWPHTDDGEPLSKSAPVFAFCGLGDPEKFFEGLRRAGCAVVATESFGDHHRFSEVDLERLWERARKLGAVLVTTEKDQQRFPSPLWLQRCAVAGLEISWRGTDGARLLRWVAALGGVVPSDNGHGPSSMGAGR